MTDTYTATLLGCGKMGSAMLKSWLDSSVLSKAHVIDPMPLPDIFADDERVTHALQSNNTPDTDILILAVKPQMLVESTDLLKKSISGETLILSIAAGKTLRSLEDIFSTEQPIVRAMPNTPAAIGKGASVAIANTATSTVQKETASRLLSTLGTVNWTNDETLIDAVTALSGSGPAYVFHLIESLTKSGEELGLPIEMAKTLARQTVIGSAALAENDSNTSAAILRQNVTSPGGTTEAALKILMDGRFQDILNEALSAAKKRSEELND